MQTSRVDVGCRGAAGTISAIQNDMSRLTATYPLPQVADSNFLANKLVKAGGVPPVDERPGQPTTSTARRPGAGITRFQSCAPSVLTAFYTRSTQAVSHGAHG